MRLITRHSEIFNPLVTKLDRNKSPYTRAFIDYSKKCDDLAKLVGTSNFIWCVHENEPFEEYDPTIPVEWLLDVQDENRILGYVDDKLWVEYLMNGGYLPNTTFSKFKPMSGKHSVLVLYPLLKKELMKKTIFNQDEEVISEQFF